MTVSSFLGHKIIHLENYSLTVFSALMATLVLLVTWISIRIIRHWLKGPRRINQLDHGRKESVFLIFKYFIWVISAIICLQIIGIQITMLLAGSAALLVGLGLGIQQIFNDLVSGMFLLFEGSVEVDDILEVDGMVCIVKKIKLRTSEVVTKDGVLKIVPNHKFITETVTNWSKQKHKYARFKTVMGVSYNSDPKQIKALLMEILENHPQILNNTETKPMVRFLEYGDSSINFELVFFTESIFRVENVMSDIRYSAFEAFRINDIEIPFPQRDLHIKGGDFVRVPEVDQ